MLWRVAAIQWSVQLQQSNVLFTIFDSHESHKRYPNRPRITWPLIYRTDKDNNKSFWSLFVPIFVFYIFVSFHFYAYCERARRLINISHSFFIHKYWEHCRSTIRCERWFPFHEFEWSEIDFFHFRRNQLIAAFGSTEHTEMGIGIRI